MEPITTPDPETTPDTPQAADSTAAKTRADMIYERNVEMGVPMPEREAFIKGMQQPEVRRKFYDRTVQTRPGSLPDYETFEAQLFEPIGGEPGTRRQGDVEPDVAPDAGAGGDTDGAGMAREAGAVAEPGGGAQATGDVADVLSGLTDGLAEEAQTAQAAAEEATRAAGGDPDAGPPEDNALERMAEEAVQNALTPEQPSEDSNITEMAAGAFERFATPEQQEARRRQLNPEQAVQEDRRQRYETAEMAATAFTRFTTPEWREEMRQELRPTEEATLRALPVERAQEYARLQEELERVHEQSRLVTQRMEELPEAQRIRGWRVDPEGRMIRTDDRIEPSRTYAQTRRATQELRQRRMELRNQIGAIEQEYQDNELMFANQRILGMDVGLDAPDPKERLKELNEQLRQGGGTTITDNSRRRELEAERARLDDVINGTTAERFSYAGQQFLKSFGMANTATLEGLGVLQQRIGQVMGSDTELDERGLIELSGSINAWLEDTFPNNERLQDQFFASVFPSVMGSMSAYMLGGVAGRAGGGLAKLAGRRAGQVGNIAGKSTPLVMAASAGAGETYHNLLQHTGNEEYALRYAPLGIGPGAIQVANVMGILNRMDKITGGAIRGSVAGNLRASAYSGFNEGVVDGLGSGMQNLLTDRLTDADVRMLEGVVDGFGPAASGGAVSSLITSVVAGRIRLRNRPKRRKRYRELMGDLESIVDSDGKVADQDKFVELMQLYHEFHGELTPQNESESEQLSFIQAYQRDFLNKEEELAPHEQRYNSLLEKMNAGETLTDAEYAEAQRLGRQIVQESNERRREALAAEAAENEQAQAELDAMDALSREEERAREREIARRMNAAEVRPPILLDGQEASRDEVAAQLEDDAFIDGLLDGQRDLLIENDAELEQRYQARLRERMEMAAESEETDVEAEAEVEGETAGDLEIRGQGDLETGRQGDGETAGDLETGTTVGGDADSDAGSDAAAAEGAAAFPGVDSDIASFVSGLDGTALLVEQGRYELDDGPEVRQAIAERMQAERDAGRTPEGLLVEGERQGIPRETIFRDESVVPEAEPTAADMPVRIERNADTGEVQVIDNKTDQVLSKRSPRYAPAVASFINQDPEMRRAERAPVEQRTDDALTDARSVLEQSRNPFEIAEAWLALQTYQIDETRLDPKERAIAETLTRVRTEDIERYIGKNQLNTDYRGIKLNYVSNDGSAQDIALVAQSASEASADGIEVTAEDVVDFMKKYPGGLRQFRGQGRNQVMEELRGEFTDLTGFDLTQRLARELVQQDPIEEYESQQELEAGPVSISDNSIEGRFNEAVAQIQEGQDPTAQPQDAIEEYIGNRGQNNRIVSPARATAAARTINRRGSLNVGLDPKVLKASIELAVFNLEDGLRRFGDFARVMIEQHGESIVPYLKRIYGTAARRANINDELTSEAGIDEWMGVYFAKNKVDTDIVTKAGVAIDQGDTLRTFLKRNPDLDIGKAIKAFNIIRAGYLHDAAERFSENAERKSTRPDLANPADTEEGRALFDLIDEQRNEDGIPGRKTDLQLIQGAKARLERDYDGERDRMLAIADENRDPDSGQNTTALTDEDNIVMRLIINREDRRYQEDPTPAQFHVLLKLRDLYRRAGTEQGRALRSRKADLIDAAERRNQTIKEGVDEGERIKENTGRMDETMDELDGIDEEGSEAVASDPELLAEIERLKREIEANERKQAENRKAIADLEAEKEQLREEMRKAEVERTRRIIEQNEQIEALQEERRKIEQRATESKAELRKARAEIKALNERIERLQGIINRIDAEFRAQIQQLQERVLELEKELEDKKMAEQLKDTPRKRAIDLLQKRIKRLEQGPRERKAADPVQVLVNELYRIVQQKVRNNNQSAAARNPLEVVADAMTREFEYREVWAEVQRRLQQEYADNPEALKLLQAYFGTVPIIQFHTSRIDQAIAYQLREMELKLQDIIRMHWSAQADVKRQLVDALITDLGLNLEQSNRLAGWIEKKFDMQVRARKKKVLEDKLLKPIKEDRISLTGVRDVDQLVDLVNLGGFDRQEFRRAIAERLGLPRLTERQTTRITELVNQIQEVAAGPARNAAVLELLRFLESEKITGGNFTHTFRRRLAELLQKKVEVEQADEDLLTAAKQRSIETLKQAMMLPPRNLQQRIDSKEITPEERDAIYEDMYQAYLETKRYLLNDHDIDLDNLTDAEAQDPKVYYTILRAFSTRNASMTQKVFEYFLNSILSSPKTHIVNIAGASLNTGMEFTSDRLMQVMLNEAAGMVEAKDFTQAQLGEMKYIYRAIQASVPKAMRYAKLAFEVEQGTFAPDMGFEDSVPKFQEANDRGASIEGTKGRVIRTPIRFILAADEFSKVSSFYGEMAALAYRQAIARGLEGDDIGRWIEEQLNDPQGDAAIEAWQMAVDQTFQTEPGPLSQSILTLRRNIPIIKFQIPFISTIATILNQGFRKSPFGIFRLGWKGMQHLLYKQGIANEWVKSGYPKKQVMRDAAEQALAWGTFMALASAWDEDDPFITGSGTYWASSDYHYRSEKTPSYAIKIGDNYYDYRRFEPIATILAANANLIEYMSDRQNEKDDAFGDFIQRMQLIITDKSYMASISELIDLSQASYSGVERVYRFVGNKVTGFSPNFMREFMRAGDDTVRDGRIIGEPGSLQWAESYLDVYRHRAFPLAPLAPPPKVDWLGRDIEKGPDATGRLSYLYHAFVPATATPDTSTLFDQLIWKHNRLNPNDEFYPTRPQTYLTLDGETVYLTPEENYRYQQLAGEYTRRQLEQDQHYLNHVLQSDELEEGQLEGAIESIQDYISQGRRWAREDLKREGLTNDPRLQPQDE